MIAMNMKYSSIILAGNGWGAIAAGKSLTKEFSSIAVLSDDEAVIAIANGKIIPSLQVLDNALIVFAGYKPFVPKLVLEHNTCINVHYSLLPAYRGLHSTVWAILNNESKLGLTIHLMDEYMDNGPIIYQYAVDNDFKSTSTEYMEVFNNHIEQNLGKVIKSFIEGGIKPHAQDKSKASWVGRRNVEDCRIDFSKPIGYQKAFFRALVAPYPLPFFTFRNKRYVVLQTSFHPSSVISHIGRILNIDNEGIWIQIADGYMVVKKMVDESGSEISYTNFTIGQYLNE